LLFLVSWHPKLSHEKIFGTSKLFKKMWSQIPLFQQISTLEPNFPMKFLNFTFVFQSCNLQLIAFPKRYFASKSATKRWKTCEAWKNHGFLTDFLFEFWEKSSVFQYSFDDISAICWPILMQSSVLETSLAVDYMPEIRMWNFKSFMGKLGFKVEIWWKKWDLWLHFLE
jgi:hypothetical protein